MLDSNNNIAFLFGAGVSVPSGLYRTDELTEKVLSGENVYRNLCGGYEVSDIPLRDEEDKYVIRIKKLFHVLNNNLGGHYSFINRQMNYEDYFYFIDTIYADESMDFENPIVAYFSDYLFKVHSSLFEPMEEYFNSLRIIDLMKEAKNYIKDLVAHYLNKKPEDLSQFNLIENLVNDEKLNKIYLFTLNHDTLVEQYLRVNKIIFSDGFVQENVTTKIWNPQSFNEKINLFKLHGSIDWSFSLSSDSYEKKVCIYLVPQRDTPETAILIGSFNKLPAYTKGINFDLQCLFAKYLNECNRLVISGYSFSDQGINSRIINWLYGSRDRKIVIIHKNEKDLIRDARPAISRIIDQNIIQENDLVRIIPKWFQETNWAEINSYLE